MQETDASGVDVRRYVDILRRRKVTVFLVAVGTTLVAVVASLLQTPVYRGTAEVLLEPAGPESIFNPGASSSGRIGSVETEIRVLQSDPVRDLVRRKLGSAPNVKGSRVGESDVMRVDSLGNHARKAAAAANAYAQAYVEFRKEQAVGALVDAGREIQESISSLQAQIDSLNGRIAQAPAAQRPSVEAELRPHLTNLFDQLGELARRKDQLDVEAALKTGDAKVVKAATVPDSPVKPRPLRNGVGALAAGLVLGAGLAFTRESFDDSIRSQEDMAAVARGLPVLAAIPAVPAWAGDHPRFEDLRDEHSGAGEAYRALRTAIQLLGVDRPIRVIQITSAIPGEGKSLTVVNLATVLASAGQRVVMVDADLRRPSLQRMVDMASEQGLTSVLAGDVPLEQAVTPVSEDLPVFVLPAGPPPPNPSELLASKRMSQVVFELQDQFEVVIMDSAPVLPVTDATLLAVWVDGTVVVTKAGMTTRRHLQEALARLRLADALILGTVLTQVSPDPRYGYQYGYPGDGQHGAKPGGRGKRRRARRTEAATR